MCVCNMLDTHHGYVPYAWHAPCVCAICLTRAMCVCKMLDMPLPCTMQIHFTCRMQLCGCSWFGLGLVAEGECSPYACNDQYLLGSLLSAVWQLPATQGRAGHKWVVLVVCVSAYVCNGGTNWVCPPGFSSWRFWCTLWYSKASVFAVAFHCPMLCFQTLCLHLETSKWYRVCMFTNGYAEWSVHVHPCSRAWALRPCLHQPL